MFERVEPVTTANCSADRARLVEDRQAIEVVIAHILPVQ